MLQVGGGWEQSKHWEVGHRGMTSPPAPVPAVGVEEGGNKHRVPPYAALGCTRFTFIAHAPRGSNRLGPPFPSFSTKGTQVRAESIPHTPPQGYKLPSEEWGHLARVVRQDADRVLGAAAQQAQHGVLLEQNTVQEGGSGHAIPSLHHQRKPELGPTPDPRLQSDRRGLHFTPPPSTLSTTGCPEPIFQCFAAEWAVSQGRGMGSAGWPLPCVPRSS